MGMGVEPVSACPGFPPSPWYNVGFSAKGNNYWRLPTCRSRSVPSVKSTAPAALAQRAGRGLARQRLTRKLQPTTHRTPTLNAEKTDTTVVDGRHPYEQPLPDRVSTVDGSAGPESMEGRQVFSSSSARSKRAQANWALAGCRARPGPRSRPGSKPATGRRLESRSRWGKRRVVHRVRHA